MLSYVIVGSGYRAMYFGRIAVQYPTLFRAFFLCRSPEKARLMEAQTGVRATTSLDECLAFQPDFAVIAVDRGHVADVAEEWISRGFPVVTETPVGDTPKKLNRLRNLKKSRAGKQRKNLRKSPQRNLMKNRSEKQQKNLRKIRRKNLPAGRPCLS